MKKVKLMMITLIMCSMSMVSFGQYVNQTDSLHLSERDQRKNYYSDKKMIKGEQVTPGSELRLYTNHHYKGVVLSFIGIPVTGLGGYILTKGGDGGPFLITAGGVLSLIGLVYILEAPIHIKRASLLLDKYGIGVKIKL